MRWTRARMLAATVVAWLAGPGTAPAVPPPPAVTITLGGRTACVTPTHGGQARAEGGLIDVTSPTPNAINALLSGSVAANAYLGCPGSATETFQLVQEFEISSPDPSVTQLTLTLDSALVGYIRSRHNAGASMRLAGVKVCPVGWPESPLVLSHPSQAVEGKGGRLCNQHLPQAVAEGMPLGRYVMTADFILTADAAGICDGHAVADFSPSTSLPGDWVRTRDPFQGVDKKGFGFSVSLTAEAANAPSSASSRARSPEVQRTSSVTSPKPLVRSARADAHGFERATVR